jgi:phosphate transport system substrate-binding protein
MVHRSLPVMFIVLSFVGQEAVLDSDIPDYHPIGSLKGAISFGPDGGFDKLLGLWTTRLKGYYPDLRGPDAGRKATLTTPRAMINGTAQCGLMSKSWSVGERDEFRDAWGSTPVELIVGADGVTIVVHRDNPLRSLKLDDLDGIYSATRNRGSRAIRTWGELGLGNAWKGKPIHAFGMKADTATIARGVFVERVLQRGTFRQDVREVDGAQGVLLAVAEDPLAIGFVTFSAPSTLVRLVPLQTSEAAAEPDLTREQILNLSYPLAWQIRLCYAKSADEPLTPPMRELLALILSRDGQTIVADEGYVPISGPMARKQTKLLK